MRILVIKLSSLGDIAHALPAVRALQARTGLPTDVLQARLLELELEGRVGRLPGGLFQRLARA